MNQKTFKDVLDQYKNQYTTNFFGDLEERILQLPSIIGDTLAEFLLTRRDGAAIFPEQMKKKFPAEKYAKSGMNGDINKAWETVGLLYMNTQSRAGDALDVFEHFYNWLLEYQEKTQTYLHKGYALVWMAQCCNLLNYHTLAKRYLMLTLCEDAINLMGDINPNTSGVYFRLVWQYGMNDKDLRKYVVSIVDKYRRNQKEGLFPEWILQDLDNEWITTFPSPTESMFYRANRRYIKYLMQNLGNRSGDYLERLAEYIISQIPGCRTYRHTRTLSTDYDVVCAMEGTQVDFRSEFGRYFVCECKDWEKAADFTTVSKFCRVLDSSKCRFGILFSKKGTTGSRNDITPKYAARELVKVFQDRGMVIVVIDKNDLKDVAEGKNFITILRTKYEENRLDLSKK